MADWKLGFVVLALSLFVLALGDDSSEGTAEEPSEAKQGGYYHGSDGRVPLQYYPQVHQRVPLQYYPPAQQRVPVQYYPPVQQQVPVQFYPPVQRRVHRPSTTRAPPIDPTMLFVFYYLIRAFSQTTTAATTTTIATTPPTAAPVTLCIGTWSDWGTCSANCAGTHSRRHSCTGAIEYQPCNQPGFTVNGWYRASNCYEYFVSANAKPHDDAKTACEALGAKLIHIGLRNATIASEVMLNLGSFSSSPEPVHIGLEYVAANTAWTWDDGDTTDAVIWALSHPPSTTPSTLLCAFMELGNPRSAEDGNCASSRNYICERQIT